MKQALDIGTQVADGGCGAREGNRPPDVKPEKSWCGRTDRPDHDFGSRSSRGSRADPQGSTVGTSVHVPEQVQGLTSTTAPTSSRSACCSTRCSCTGPLLRGARDRVQYEIVNVDPADGGGGTRRRPRSTDRAGVHRQGPADRYQSAAEVAKELRRFKRNRDGHARAGCAGVPPAPAATPPVLPPHPRPQLPHAAVRASLDRRRALDSLLLLSSCFSGHREPARTRTTVSCQLVDRHPRHHPTLLRILRRPAQLSRTGCDRVRRHPPNGVARLYVRKLAVDAVVQLEGTRARHILSGPRRQVVGTSRREAEAHRRLGRTARTVTSRATPGGELGGGRTLLFTRLPDRVFRVPRGAVRRCGTVLDTAAEKVAPVSVVSPGRRHFLYLARVAATPERPKAMPSCSAPSTAPRRRPAPQLVAAVFAAGRILFVRAPRSWHNGSMRHAVRDREPERLHDGVLFDASYNLGAFSVSRNGLLLFQREG